ncbi:MAG: sulfatase-like hydrolase/transferase [Alphaproteobacteria bacterium]
MTNTNVLFIMSDEHRPDAMGAAGHSLVRTPNLDRLAAAGTRFSAAYTPSPVCVSARASIMTGRWVHEIGHWSSAEPYRGEMASWGHRLGAAGCRVESIGKLHFRSSEDDNGFAAEHLALHVSGGLGWLKGLMRASPPSYDEGTSEFARDVGVGETSYTAYDRRICAAALAWLAEAPAAGERPWVLFVSFVSPHFPLIAPAPYWDLYDGVELGRPHRPEEEPSHPSLRALYRFYNYRDHMTPERAVLARRGYFALCSYLDGLVGELLDALDATGRAGDTTVIYTSDHGEMLGDHGMWTKMLMNDASAGVPLIVRGPGVPAGAEVRVPVSLVDLYPTILECAGVGLGDGAASAGHSLIEIANGAVADRPVLSEFHDGGAPTGTFMLRRENWKYVHYVGERAQLFDLAGDPMEDADLGAAPEHSATRRELEGELRAIVDPEAANRRAFADQARRLAALGGREAVLAMSGVHFGYTPLGEATTG